MPRYKQFGLRDEPELPDGDAGFTGVNLRLSPELLPPGTLSLGENLRCNDGVAETRRGVVKPGWANPTRAYMDAVIRPFGSVQGVGSFKDPASVEWTLIAADGLIYRARPHNALFSLPLPSGVRIRTDCAFVQAFGRVFCFRGRHLAPLRLADIDDGFEDLLPHWDAAETYATDDEITYGPFVTVQTSVTLGVGALTSVSTLATVAHVAHGYATGDSITISGATQTEYNGTYEITVLDADNFTYVFAGSGTSPATGTIKMVQSAVTRVDSTVTVVTSSPHGYVTGADITVSGATQTDYNGRFNITVLNESSFTYQAGGSPDSPATGTIAVSNMRHYYKALGATLAGQSPDTNPASWERIYNILPNADNALYTDNRLLVPTAYTPGTADYDASSAYGKADFVVATDIQDELHFSFVNEFRINQGGDDELVELVKFNDQTVIPFKERSWGVLENVYGDFADTTLDMKPQYGLSAPRAWAVVGADIFFMADRIGVVSLRQTEQNKLQGVDVPISRDIDPWIKRINWTHRRKIRLAYWDNKLYVAVPLDDAKPKFTTASRIDATLSGLRWNMPCIVTETPNPYACETVNPDDVEAVLDGDPGTTYDVTLRIRGVIEVLNYFGGSSDGSYFQTGGTPDTDGHNIYRLTVSYPPAVYYLNRHSTGDYNAVRAVDYTCTIHVQGGATVTLHADGVNGGQVRNQDDSVVVGVSPYPEVYDGQFLQMDVDAVEAAEDPDPIVGVNNAVLVYDFLTQSWAGMDTGRSLLVKEWFIRKYNGVDRLFFLGFDGFVNLYEEALEGDQNEGAATDSGLAMAGIETRLRTRGYQHQAPGFKRVSRLAAVLQTWDPNYTVTRIRDGVNETAELITGETKDRTRYYQPFNAPAYDVTNVNDDHGAPYREDYSVPLTEEGFEIGSGVDPHLTQETIERVRVNSRGRFTQVEIVNLTGRLRLKQVALDAIESTRRHGVMA